MVKFKKDYIPLIVFIILLLVVFIFVLRNSETLGLRKGQRRSATELGVLRPAYLKESIPKIDKIKTVVDNPKFKEMKYDKNFFDFIEKIETTESGRVNPFIPFRINQKEQEEE